jgi:hypothetical protein
MSEDLDEALPPDQLYDYRANSHIELCAPYQQGDAFRSDALGSSSVDGGDSLVMLFMHPCTMRRAGALEKFVTVVRIKQESPRKLLRPDFWRHHYKVMPLPDLLGDGSSTHSADFMHISTIESSALPRTERIAQLSTAGRHALYCQHRLAARGNRTHRSRGPVPGGLGVCGGACPDV